MMRDRPTFRIVKLRAQLYRLTGNISALPVQNLAGPQPVPEGERP